MTITGKYTEFRELADAEALSSVPHEYRPYIKRASLPDDPIAYHNKCCMYFDRSSLPPCCAGIKDLMGRNVVYGIYCRDKFYIGSTGDFGERVSTHIKESRGRTRGIGRQQLYRDMADTGECVVFVCCICGTIGQARSVEHDVIRLCKQYSVRKKCEEDGYADGSAEGIGEGRDSLAKEFEQAGCYNIND